MIARVLTPLLVAGAAAAAVAFAPVAVAVGNAEDCDARGTATACPKTGYASVNAGAEATRAGNSTWPFGAGQAQPNWEFD